MKQMTLFFLFFLISTSVVFTQDKHRGYSNPGFIGKKPEKVVQKTGASDIQCTLSLQEPSGDGVLGEGETGTVKILVKNQNPSNPVEPKLEVTARSSRMSQPLTGTKFMNRIEPNQTAAYNVLFKWEEKYSLGTVTFNVKASDQITGKVYEPVELTFRVGEKEKPVQPAKPVLVDVDGSVPDGPIRNPDAVAVIIGNGDYIHDDIPDVAYSINDATAMRKYIINTFGYREENIIFIKNSTKADFETVFGTKDVPEGKLYNYVKPNRSDVFVYYSGHGAPDPSSKKPYFMPVNCDPYVNLRLGGYPLETFYQNLEKLPAKSVTVVIDACFSGSSPKGMLIKNASPMFIDVQFPMAGTKCNVFTSATGDQIASWYPEEKHSLFTYYFLRAMQGEADQNKDRRITVGEVKNYIDENVPYFARRKYGREQTPVVKGNPDAVISTY